jgi:hypothetical protein
MLKPLIITGTLLTVLYTCPLNAEQPKQSQDSELKKEIRSLELCIATGAKKNYQRFESDQHITYENTNVILDPTTRASIVIVYDKQKREYAYFSMNVHGRKAGTHELPGMLTIEQHFDDGLNGYADPSVSPSNDLFSAYDPVDGELSHQNMLIGAQSENVQLFNEQLRKRLLQTNCTAKNP